MRDCDKEAAVRRKQALKGALKELLAQWIENDGIDSAIVVTAFAEVTGEACLVFHGPEQAQEMLSELSASIRMAARPLHS